MMGKAVMRWRSNMISTNIFIQPAGIARTMLSSTWDKYYAKWRPIRNIEKLGRYRQILRLVCIR